MRSSGRELRRRTHSARIRIARWASSVLCSSSKWRQRKLRWMGSSVGCPNWLATSEETRGTCARMRSE
eukprot:4054339-Alexandrium_andersonii.AAC.1